MRSRSLAAVVVTVVAALIGAGTGVSAGVRQPAKPGLPKAPATLTPSGRSPDATFAALAAKADARPGIRVVAGLDVSTRPEGVLAKAAVAAQRRAIAAAQRSAVGALAGTPFVVRHRYTTIPYLSLEVSGPAIAALRTAPAVRTVAEVVASVPATADSVPLVGGRALSLAGYDGYVSYRTNGRWVVAVLDTGVAASHPMLNGKVVAEACFADDCSTVTDGIRTFTQGAGTGAPCTFNTGCDHGTHVAGIAAGTSVTIGPTSAMGMARGAEIMSVRVFSQSGSSITAFNDDLAAGLDHVATTAGSRPIAAVNMSIGGQRFTWECPNAEGESTPVADAIGNLASLNIPSIVASGNNAYDRDVDGDGVKDDANMDGAVDNNYADGIGFPGCLPYAVSVGNTTKTDAVTSSSQDSAALDVLAPGTNINSAVLGGQLGVKSGTSMAAPHVAGAFTVAREVNPSIPYDEVLTALKTTGQSVADNRSGNARTHPRIKACDAVATLVQKYKPESYRSDMCTPGATVYNPDTTNTELQRAEWHGWYSKGGQLTSGAGIASWGSGRWDAFARGTDYALWHYNYEGAYSRWEYLGGILGSDPAAVSWGYGRYDVFARGRDGQLWHIPYEGGWGQWEPLGGYLIGGPAVASQGRGMLDVFARGGDNALYQKSFDAVTGWSDWKSLGGQLTSDPAAVAWGNGRIDVFARSTDNALWQKTFEAGVWKDWQSRGGVLAGGPAVASAAAGHLDVYARGTDGNLWHKEYFEGWQQPWKDWKSTYRDLISDPDAVHTGNGRIDIVARRSDNALSHLYRW
jgi:hypothetical protein